jgi:uncharacterized hydrophobic protein (TIGR00341 family)
MATELRQIEVILPARNAEVAVSLLAELGVNTAWSQVLQNDHMSIRFPVPFRTVEEAMDRLSTLITGDPTSRVMVTEIVATLPRPAVDEPDESAGTEEPKFGPDRVTREELYTNASRGGRISSVYLVLVVLSSVVASVGIIRDNTGVVIGAMVIAPLLGPSVALSLGATLGDSDLMKRAAAASMVGFGIALGIAVAIGLTVNVDTTSVELTSRTDIGSAEVALALASGIAAALAFTTGASSALIGVMVAVALLPPTVVLGMLVANGEWTLARGAGLLLLLNISALNLTAVITFAIQGVRPARWWEAAKARKSTRIMIAASSLLLVLLVVSVLLEP